MARFKAAKSLWLDILQKGKLSVFAACSSSDPSPEDEFNSHCITIPEADQTSSTWFHLPMTT